MFWTKYDEQYRREVREKLHRLHSLSPRFKETLDLMGTLVEFEVRRRLGVVPVPDGEISSWIASLVRFCEPDANPPVCEDETDPELRKAFLTLLDAAIECRRNGYGFHLFLADLVELILQRVPRVDDDGIAVEVPLVEAAEDAEELVPSVWQQVGEAARTPSYFWFFRNVITRVLDNEKRLPKGKLPPAKLAQALFDGTPFLDLFALPVRVGIPQQARFEHTHIVGGTGHGKTQLIQHMLLADLPRVARGEASVVVIDSQGDLIRTILSMRDFSPHGGSLAARLVLIDPHDIEYPPCLNLFDFGLDRAQAYSPVEREKLLNGAIALYDYLFGALLGSDLTQRQGLVFRYLARLMLAVDGGTIHTLREFCENPQLVRAFLPALDDLTREFFETVFFSRQFEGTRRQILTRLWGVLSNTILERMFSNPKNKVNLFQALNEGSVVLIHTAKDLLKQEGCELLGRFFISLIAHAAQERALLPPEARTPTFVYIDEAHDYLDQNVDYLLNQARKYRVGMVLAHQNLEQLSDRIHATMMSSTSVKIVGGLSFKDARAFAREMRCTEDELLAVRKHADHTEFALWVRNHLTRPVRMRVPFGQMEARGTLTPQEREALLAIARARVSEPRQEYRSERVAPAVPLQVVKQMQEEGTLPLPPFEPL